MRILWHAIERLEQSLHGHSRSSNLGGITAADHNHAYFPIGRRSRIGGFHDHHLLDALATLVLSDCGEYKLCQFALGQNEPRHTSPADNSNFQFSKCQFRHTPIRRCHFDGICFIHTTLSSYEITSNGCITVAPNRHGARLFRLVQESLVGEPYAILELRPGPPAQLRKATDVEQLAWGAIRL
jgi:hypothetical protein